MASTHPLLAPLQAELEHLQAIPYTPTEKRSGPLGQLVNFLKERKVSGEPIRLNFICTHNSRRSHIGQLWAQALGFAYGYDDLKTYSGGTEGTAFNPNAIAALKAQGFEFQQLDETVNPHWQVSYATGQHTEAWSKVYSDEANPKSGYGAVMVCSEADEACPIVFGATERVSLPYEDPKKSDGTPAQEETYLARARQIARELIWVFEAVE